MSFFPASLCDLSSLWIRHDLSFSALVQRAELYHPRCHEDIVAALAAARGAAYDAKYAVMEGYDDERSLTTRHWYKKLMARKEEAINFVGIEKFRLWALYLAGVSIGFTDGSMHICQIVATKHSAKGASGLPLTRADLYVNKDG